MATFAITFILLTLYLIPFGNCLYLPNEQYLIPNGGNQLIGSAGGGDFPSASSRIQNGPRDLPNGQYLIPNGGNQLIGSAGGGDFPSASSRIQNGPRDLPNGQYLIPNGRNQLTGSAGGGGFPIASSTIQNRPRDSPYYVPRQQQPNYRKDIIEPGAGPLPFPNKYAAYPTESGLTNPTITVNSVNTAVSTSSSEPSSNQFAELGTTLEDF